jgi:hypothetical protein
MMLTYILQNFKKRIYHNRNRRSDQQISFAERLTAARVIVVCLPEEKEHFNAFIGPLGKMSQIFPKARVTLVYHKKLQIPKAYRSKFTLIEWDEQDLDRYGIPRSSLLQKIYDRPYDVAIDLSPDKHFANLAIAQSSRAPIKVCLANPERESLYNFILNPRTDQDPGRIINSLLAYLNP